MYLKSVIIPFTKLGKFAKTFKTKVITIYVKCDWIIMLCSWRTIFPLTTFVISMIKDASSNASLSPIESSQPLLWATCHYCCETFSSSFSSSACYHQRGFGSAPTTVWNVDELSAIEATCDIAWRRWCSLSGLVCPSVCLPVCLCVCLSVSQ